MLNLSSLLCVPEPHIFIRLFGYFLCESKLLDPDLDPDFFTDPDLYPGGKFYLDPTVSGVPNHCLFPRAGHLYIPR